MGIFDLFRPRWKHSDPETRAAAVRALRGSSDPDALAKLAEDETDSAVRKVAAEQLGERLLALALGADETLARSALERLREARALAKVARNGALTSLRMAAIARVE